MRQLKAAKAEKSVVTAAVAELLDLKKRLADLEAKQQQQKPQQTPPVTDKPSAPVSVSPGDLEKLTKEVAEQV